MEIRVQTDTSENAPKEYLYWLEDQRQGQSLERTTKRARPYVDRQGETLRGPSVEEVPKGEIRRSTNDEDDKVVSLQK